MGISYGRNAGNRSGTYSAKLAANLGAQGAGKTEGGKSLLGFMRGKPGGGDHTITPQEAKQAAQDLKTAANKLRGDDRRIANQIADDAQEAADSGRPWTIG